jgi:hypothetical protein
MAGRSRSKNGVASLVYDPAIHRPRQRTTRELSRRRMDCRVKPGNDE